MTNVSFARPSTSIAEIILPATGMLAIDDLDCLADRLERANADEALRVLVVRSAADVFSSGADPVELASIDDLAGLSATVTRFFEALIGCDKIMIAAVGRSRSPINSLPIVSGRPFQIIWTVDELCPSITSVTSNLICRLARATDLFGWYFLRRRAFSRIAS
ncbi:enoyl-CoA hydratase/isomerase family protein [Pinisolibacter aquiterrae]|uniref:enoyl-CoA hydratase/isomerase family protein n=1 Tax=Pinisolibacter aquiterrae TaxID=2815579 RepID=UPI001E44C92B|nr:hypothetical protein [Pinisolibacter aquiterrae]MCC8235800.1 hypothetical protein [Pinisolibacter aquiterrae]